MPRGISIDPSPHTRDVSSRLVRGVRAWVGLSGRAGVFGIFRILRRKSEGGLLALLLSLHLEPGI